MRTRFADRSEAGRQLAAELAGRRWTAPVVVALPRGGVPIAVEVARVLHAPVELIMVRKIGAPWQPEFAVAAVVDGARPEVVLNEAAMHLTGIDRAFIDRQAAQELAEIERRRKVYLRGRPQLALSGRTAVLVDDGIATGTTVRAAIAALRRAAPARLVLAVPVAACDAVRRLQAEVDELVCLYAPDDFDAVGAYYRHFEQVSDDEVVRLLDRAHASTPDAGNVSGS